MDVLVIPQFVHLSLFPVLLSQLDTGAHFQVVGDKKKVFRIEEEETIKEIGVMEGLKYLPHSTVIEAEFSEKTKVRVYVVTKTNPKPRSMYVQGRVYL